MDSNKKESTKILRKKQKSKYQSQIPITKIPYAPKELEYICAIEFQVFAFSQNNKNKKIKYQTRNEYVKMFSDYLNKKNINYTETLPIVKGGKEINKIYDALSNSEE